MTQKANAEDGKALMGLSDIFGRLVRGEGVVSGLSNEALEVIAHHRIAAYDQGKRDGMAELKQAMDRGKGWKTNSTLTCRGDEA